MVEESFDEAFRRVLGGHESLADEWPYQNPVYLSAAVRHEAAWDIPAERARAERPTIDGNAHGAFTDSLLRALRGDADLDQDGQIAYRELHNFLLQRLQRDGQTPQLHVHAEEIGTGPVLGRRSPERRIQPGVLQSSALRVRIDPPADEIVSLLRGEDGIVVTGGEFDLELRRRGHAIRAYHPSGALIDGTSMTTRAAVRLVRRRAEAHRITLVSYPQQDLHLDTSIEPVQGVYFRGDRLVATMRPDERAWLLLLAIDAGGGATVLYAQHREDSRPIAAGELVEAVRVQAAAPYGTDLLEAFAWRDKPTGYDYWAGEDGLLKRPS